MMRFSVSAVILSLCAVMAHASPMPQSPPAGVDLSKVYIEDATFAGGGCPAGSVKVSKSTDWTNIILSFGSYSASIGPEVPFPQRRRNCNLNTRFHFPFGLQITDASPFPRPTTPALRVWKTRSRRLINRTDGLLGSPKIRPQPVAHWLGPSAGAIPSVRPSITGRRSRPHVVTPRL